MTHPEYTVQGLLQAIDEYERKTLWTLPKSVLQRARDLTAATPAPAAAGDAVRVLTLAHEAKEWAQELDYFHDITHRLAVPELRIFMRRVAALANPPQSAGTGDGVEGEGV